MKRELIQNVKVQPYTTGDALDRTGFLSAILGGVIGTAGELTVTVTHSDDGTTFEAVTDTKVFPDKDSENGAITIKDLKADEVVNIDVDLVGLKNHVKFAVTGTAATSTTLAVALGDSANQPV